LIWQGNLTTKLTVFNSKFYFDFPKWVWHYPFDVMQTAELWCNDYRLETRACWMGDAMAGGSFCP
jgi:hypothetical protein